MHWQIDVDLVMEIISNTSIPVWFTNRNILLNNDIVASDIRLLLSRKPMKKADMNLDYKRNQSIIILNVACQQQKTTSEKVIFV